MNIRGLFLFLITLVNWGFTHASPVDSTLAHQVAINYFQSVTGNSNISLSLAHQAHTSLNGVVTPGAKQPLYYLFNVVEQPGFVLVAGDDRVVPILGYSLDQRHDVQQMPDALIKWLETYRKEIIYVVDHDLEPSTQIKRQWQALRGTGTATVPLRSVNPLMTTTWNQAPFYNGSCPFDNTYNERTVTGCVATAMAQIMKYWNYPAQGTDFHSYNHQQYGTLSANFGATTYDWGSMPNNLTSNNQAVATLMYHCGVSVDMNYGVAATGGSGAYVVTAASPLQHCSEYAFETYFGYDANTLQGVLRNNYTTSSWVQTLKNELDNGRPILYAGFGNGGGHAWVCDGYDNQDFFHMNWGWGGNSDGFFWVDALNPGSLGAGGGTGGFNSNQQAVIGIQPPGGGGGTPPPSAHDLFLYASVVATPNPVIYGGTLNVTFNVQNGNNASSTFFGDIGVAMFDETGSFVDFVDNIYTESNGLPGGFIYTGTGLGFSTNIDVIPGQYYLGAYARPPGGEWTIIDAGNYDNFISLIVTVNNEILISSDFTLSSDPLEQGQGFNVNVNVVNAGSTTFTGTYSIDLHNLDGSYVGLLDEIQENDGLPAGFTYQSPGLPFSVPNLNVEPGSYLLVLWERATNGDWEIVASDGNFVNPIQVTVVAPPISPDIYEDNDSESNAYPTALNPGVGSASFTSTGSNIHIGSDYDHYKVDIPAGVSYTINARAQDSWDNDDGETYTNDVLFSYSLGGGTYSEAFDDVMNGPIVVNGPQTVYFRVAPYFQGETGSYALDISVNVGPVSITEFGTSSPMRVYPNPVEHELTVELPTNAGTLEYIGLLDVTGREVWTPNSVPVQAQQFFLSGWDIPAGTYVLRVRTERGQWKKSLIIK